MKITGNSISKGSEKSKKAFNPTERQLIYSLYFKFQNNNNECFKIKQLAEELEKSEGNLKNSITNIHKTIGKTVSKDTPPTVLFIKNEPKRGYHLNSKLLALKSR